MDSFNSLAGKVEGFGLLALVSLLVVAAVAALWAKVGSLSDLLADSYVKIGVIILIAVIVANAGHLVAFGSGVVDLLLSQWPAPMS